jgi:hypothetical protein
VKPAVFTSEAQADVEEAFVWYEAHRPGLGETFRRAVDLAVESIEAHPEAYAILHRQTRRVLLPRFPTGCTIASSTGTSSLSRVCMASVTPERGALVEEG